VAAPGSVATSRERHHGRRGPRNEAEPAARIKLPWNLGVAAYGLDFSPDGA